MRSKMTRFSPASDIAVVDRGELGMDIVNPNTGEKHCWFNAVGEVSLFMWLSQKMKESKGWAKHRAIQDAKQWTEEEAPKE